MDTFQNLNAWKEAHKLVLMIYTTTKTFPSDERFRLIDQLCRSASSVAANLVEGNARLSRKEHIQFVNLSKGSLEETKYHLLLAKDLDYITMEKYNVLLDQAHVVGRLITGLLRFLQKS